MSDEAEKLARRVRDALGVHNDDDAPVTELVGKLAARAAPQPPAEAQPVAWIAQCELDSLKDAARGVLKAYGLVWSAPTGQAGVALYDCSPPSAPVGVEELVERMRQAPDRLWMADLVGQKISVERMRDILTFALAQQPTHVAPVGDSLLQTALRNLPQYISKSGLVGPDMHSAMQCFEVLRDAIAQQPAAVDDAWRQKAAEWLEAKAVEQEAANQKWPSHAACYKEWRDRPGILRHLAIQVLAAQPGGSDDDR